MGVLLLLQFCLFLSKYSIILLVQALLYGMFAMSLDLIMGYAGIVSFGHGAFFGIGGYTLGLLLVKCGFSIWTGLALVIIVTSFYGYLVGYFSSRLKGIYFAILTLAFGEVVYRIVFYSDFTGGSDGLIGIPKLPLSLKGIFSISIDTPQRFCYFTLIVVLLSYLILRKMTISPFGKVLEAIRENEDDGFLGFNVNQYKIISFIVSDVL
jgi:branched-chain amino acid transport system permease protein